jgi:hypothetical protein
VAYAESCIQNPNTGRTLGPLARLSQDYASELAQRSGKAASVRHFLNAVGLYARAHGEGLPTREALQAFVRQRLQAGTRAVTVTGNLRQLRVRLRWGVRRGHVALDVQALFDGVFPRAERPLPKAVPWGGRRQTAGRS